MAVMIPTEMLNEIQQFFRLSDQELARVLGVDKHTIELWLRREDEPGGVNLQALQRMLDLKDLLLKTYKTPQASLEWMGRENRVFERASPRDFLLIQGPSRIIAYLKRPNEAIFS